MSEEHITTENFKAELERLRAKYRREAINAVEKARKEGYEKGLNDSKIAAEDQTSLLKATSSATIITNNKTTALKPQKFIQYVLEHIYRDIKKECSNTNTTTLSQDQIKVKIDNRFYFLRLYAYIINVNTSSRKFFLSVLMFLWISYQI